MNTGLVEGWPKSNFNDSGFTLRIPPFRYTVVSINPAVVLTTPFEFGSPEGRSLSELVEPLGTRECLGSGHLVNGAECDIAAVYAPGMQWFSPDLKVTPTLIPWRDDRAEIPLANGEVLVLTHDAAMAHTERKRAGG